MRCEKTMKIYIEKEIVKQYGDVYVDLTPDFIQDLVNNCKTVEDIKLVLAMILSSEPIFALQDLNCRLMKT